LPQNNENGGGKMERLRLVRPEKKHKVQAVEYLEEFNADRSKTHGAGGLGRYKNDYDGWLEKLAADRVQMPSEGRVPAETFFLMKSLSRASHLSQGYTERLIGMINIRFVLNDSLWQRGGHIGYSIRPSERRKGYNKVNLYLALRVCWDHGIKIVLLDCDKDNIGSAKTMQALGGKLLREYPCQNEESTDIILQWYVIDVGAALTKYANRYNRLISEYPS